MDIGFDGSTAMILKQADDLDDNDYMIVFTPTVAILQTVQTITHAVQFMIFLVLEKQPTSATVTHVYSSDGNQVTVDLQLVIGTNFTVDHAIAHHILSRDATDLLDAEIKEYEKIVLLRNRAFQVDLGIAGGGAPAGVGIQHSSQHSSNAQQLDHSIAKQISGIFELPKFNKFYPDIQPGGQHTAAHFQFPAMETAARKAIDTAGEMSSEKFPTISPAKLKDLALWRFDQFSLLDLLPKDHSLSSAESIQKPFRLLAKFARHYVGHLWSLGLTFFMDTILHLSQYSAQLNFDSTIFLDIIHKRLFNVSRSFDIAHVTACCPVGTAVDLFLVQELQEAFTITTRDDNILFILFNPPHLSTGGGSVSSVGNKRQREPKHLKSDTDSDSTATNVDHRHWLRKNPIPGASICWDWVRQKGSCGNSPTCHRWKPQQHRFPAGTQASTREEFSTWLDEKPDSN